MLMVLFSGSCNAETKTEQKKNEPMINLFPSLPKDDANQNAESLIWRREYEEIDSLKNDKFNNHP